MKKSIRIFLILILIGVLAFIRKLSDGLFYDPFTDFFKHDYLTKLLPELNYFKLGANLFFRYGLNVLVSLAIIYLVFLKKSFVIFSLWVYLIGFVVFATLYFILIINYQQDLYLFLFYCRRFLIHPLLLLLLLPAFYYFKTINN